MTKEYIEREAFIEDIKTEITNLRMDGLKGTLRSHGELYEFIDRINEQPAADVVEVVRCEDCTKFKQNGKYYSGMPFGYCYHWYYEPCSHPNEVDGDDYCSYGERKEEDK